LNPIREFIKTISKRIAGDTFSCLVTFAPLKVVVVLSPPFMSHFWNGIARVRPEIEFFLG
jgi:hypothetical protein